MATHFVVGEELVFVKAREGQQMGVAGNVVAATGHCARKV
jgi:hypothetical protein